MYSNVIIKNFGFQKPYEQSCDTAMWLTEDMFYKVLKEMCKYINSSVNGIDFSAVVRQLIKIKKVSKCFKHKATIKSDEEDGPHIHQATANKKSSEIASLKIKIEAAHRKLRNLQDQKHYHNNKDKNRKKDNDNRI